MVNNTTALRQPMHQLQRKWLGLAKDTIESLFDFTEVDRLDVGVAYAYINSALIFDDALKHESDQQTNTEPLPTIS